MITRLANCALKLAEAGFRVFPAYGIVDGKCECGNPNCNAPGKHPAIKGWKQKATSDKEQIMTWWKRCGNHNPAIATGKGLVVLDVDGETGKESLRKLEEEYGALPPTQCVLTGRGIHYYFHSDIPLQNSTSVLGKKLDIRGEGGLVIGDGGAHVSGRSYTWCGHNSPSNLPLSELPAWIPERLHRIEQDEKYKEREKKAEEPGFSLPEGMIQEGTRDTTLYKYGCYLRGVCGKDMEQIREELFRINDTKCNPPLEDEQIRKIIHQVDKFARKGGAEEDFDSIHPVGLVCAADVEDEEARFILFPYLPEGQLTLIQGNPGDGKTAFACWFAALVSCGQAMGGLSCEQGNILLLSVEDDMPVLKKRYVASGGDVNRCFFVSNASGLSFTSPEIEQYILEKKIRLVIFDPLQAFLGSKVDMNRANETRPVLAELKEMAQRNNCAVVIISHINKGNREGLAIQRALGSMDIPGACRSVLHIGRWEEDQDQRLMIHVKSSNAKEGSSILFSIVHDGGVQFREFTNKGYEDLSELSKKTRKASKDNFLQQDIINACKELLKKYPAGIKIRYKDMPVAWPSGVRPGVLLESFRSQLEAEDICIQTGIKYNGGAAVLITSAPGFLN